MAHSTTDGNNATARRRLTAAALLAVFAIVILAALLRLEGLGRDSLQYDETRSLQYAQWPISHPRHWNNGMALYHATLHGWIRLAGESEAALRFPSALFGVAAVACLIALVRRINGRTAALVAGLMLTLAWRHVYYSQEARAYSLFIMLAVLATLLLVRLLERPGTGRLIAYGAVLVALAYSHYQWIFVVAFHNLAVLFSRRRVGWGWLVLHITVVVAYVPQILLGVLPSTGWSPVYVARRPGLYTALGVLRDFFSVQLDRPVAGALPRTLEVNVLAFYLMPIIALAGIASCAQPFMLRLAPRLRKILPTLTRYVAPTSLANIAPCLTWLPLVWFGAVFVLPFVIAQTGQPVFRWRYMAGTLPPYCWFIGLGIAALPRTWFRLPLIALCILLAAPALETMKVIPSREDWRGCTEAISAEEEPGDHIVFSPGWIDRAFDVYYRGSLPRSHVFYGRTTDDEIAEALAWTEPPGRVWLVVSHNPSPGIIDYFERRPDYRLVSHRDQDFRGVALLLFERIEQNAPGDTG